MLADTVQSSSRLDVEMLCSSGKGTGEGHSAPGKGSTASNLDGCRTDTEDICAFHLLMVKSPRVSVSENCTDFTKCRSFVNLTGHLTDVGKARSPIISGELQAFFYYYRV